MRSSDYKRKHGNVLWRPLKEKTKRYSNNNLLTHLIGYIKTSENEGVSGIEKYMNDELKENYFYLSSLIIYLYSRAVLW